MKIVCFGEVLMRLNPPSYQRFVQAQTMAVSYSGSEANVAVSLANFGQNTKLVTKLPDHALGQAAINSLRSYGVNCDHILLSQDRLGIYFVEKGYAQRASAVIYDRLDSAIAKAKKKDFDWQEIFQGATWFHFSGITPALAPELVDICADACREAKKQGLTISMDLNYREKLWTRDQAQRAMERLFPKLDYCFANEEDFSNCLGIKLAKTKVEAGEINQEDYIKLAQEVKKKYDLKGIGISLRQSMSANFNLWSGFLYLDKKPYFAKNYEIDIVDRVGAGDSFSAGLIYAFLNDLPAQEIIDFAVAASCLKHSIEDDFNLASLAEVKKLLSGDSSGRISR